jgi:predicted dithiol-disulfide oxidoreductase (DUF899 family)
MGLYVSGEKAPRGCFMCTSARSLFSEPVQHHYDKEGNFVQIRGTSGPELGTDERGRNNELVNVVLSPGKADTLVNRPPIVSPQEWEAARAQLLVSEKELTRARDALAAKRRRMPWMAVEKRYEFIGQNGNASLVDLFEDRRQLIVYRAFHEPGVLGWPDHACRGCSLIADNIGHVAHLNARDTTLAFASRASQADIDRVKARMGWKMPWYTMTDTFDADFGVDEWHGTNVFFRDGDSVFRTYFIDNRGDEALGSTWSYLDVTALGRQETWEDSPDGYPQTPPYAWWNWHDNYDAPPDPRWADIMEDPYVAAKRRAASTGNVS